MDNVQDNLQKRGWSARKTHADRDRVMRENQKENKKERKNKKQFVREKDFHASIIILELLFT